MTKTPVYKLLTKADWDAACRTGRTEAAVDIADGYVHLSTASQVAETARRYFTGVGPVRLLRFHVETLGDIRWEPSRGGELFPHLYGALEISRADAGWWLEPDELGMLVFPEGF